MKDKSTKKEEALIREDAYSKLTTRQKIDKLNKKLGKGLGAKKERARLVKKLIKKKKL